MLSQGAEQGTAQAQAEQHKETRKVVDAHLEGLWWVEHRHQLFTIMADSAEPWPRKGTGWPREGPEAMQLDWEAGASC